MLNLPANARHTILVRLSVDIGVRPSPCRWPIEANGTGSDCVKLRRRGDATPVSRPLRLIPFADKLNQQRLGDSRGRGTRYRRRAQYLYRVASKDGLDRCGCLSTVVFRLNDEAGTLYWISSGVREFIELLQPQPYRVARSQMCSNSTEQIVETESTAVDCAQGRPNGCDLERG